MLYDRGYMRAAEFRSEWSATKIILVVNAVVFVIQNFLRFWTNLPVERFFYLSAEGLKNGYIFQLITYQFLHAGLFHLLCNLIVIYFFGREMENVLGRREFFKLYFSGGVIGGIVQVLLAELFPSYFGGPVLGASAAAFALVAAFASLFPDRVIYLLLFFVLPISMRARTLLWIAIALAAVGIMVPDSHIAHGAHLGGILAGVVFVRYFVRGSEWSRRPTSRWLRWPRRRWRGIRVRAMRARQVVRNRPVEAEEMLDGDFISREIDPILDKISAHGLHSLTERERRILEAARTRMSKR